MAQMLALKTDAGSGALEQMVLAEYCTPHFATHVPALTRGLRAKLDTLVEALNAQFGTSAEFEAPKGGIFLWVKLPDNVDTLKLYQAALKDGVSINPGPEWSTDKTHSKSRLRLCFASPTHQEIREGIAVLADVCRTEFGVPLRSANVAKDERRLKRATHSAFILAATLFSVLQIMQNLNSGSEFSRLIPRNVPPKRTFTLSLLLPWRKDNMKKIAFAIAALGAIAIAAPSIANAETVVVRHGGQHMWPRAHASRRGHPLHRHHDRTVVIKHHHVIDFAIQDVMSRHRNGPARGHSLCESIQGCVNRTRTLSPSPAQRPG